MKPLEVLQIIAPQLSGVEWALSGSLALKLHGLALEARDLDIQTDGAGAQKIAKILAAHKISQVPFDPDAIWVRSRWIKFEINAVSVDLMGDLEYRYDDIWKPAPDFKPHIRWIMTRDTKIPVLSLGYLRDFYVQLRRTQRVRQIRSHLLL